MIAVLVGTVPMMVALPAGAHPLGNYTINHYAGLVVSSDRILIDYVIDMAEIPAFQEQREIDGDGNGEIDQEEGSHYRDRRCVSLARGLELRVDGQALPPDAQSSTLTFPPGQAGLPTLRLECTYSASVPAGVNEHGRALVLADRNYEERIGWREITVRGDGVALETTAPLHSASDRLRAYPSELTASVLDRRRVDVRVMAGAANPAPNGPAAVPARARPDQPSGGFGSLLAETDHRPLMLLISLVAATGLGIAHALAPGHGKLVMASYLVGTRAPAREAVGLGVAVAISHTLGVVALGVITMGASAAFGPERVLPYLQLLSGAVVTLVGAWLAREAWRKRGAPPPEEHDHDHARDDRRHRKPAWKVMVALGVSGGLVPSTSAVLVLLGAVHLDRLALGLALISAFGIGMAVTLVLIGMGLTVLTTGARMATLGRRAHLLRAQLLPAAAAVVFMLGTGMTLRAVLRLG